MMQPCVIHRVATSVIVDISPFSDLWVIDRLALRLINPITCPINQPQRASVRLSGERGLASCGESVKRFTGFLNMSNASTYAALNELLINVGRSLLQYVGESWPWADADKGEAHRKVQDLVQRQKRQIRQLVELLYEGEWTIDFGSYPTEYTDLHYVALDFLLDQMIHNQQALVEDARRTLAACEGHPEALKLVAEIQKTQESIAQELEALLKTPVPSQDGNGLADAPR